MSIKKQIRELGKRFLGNICLVRKIMFYRKADPSVFWEQSGHAPEDFTDEIRKDMVASLFKYGCSYEEYFFYDFLRNKDKNYRKSFITDYNRFTYYAKLNQYKNLALFDDKRKTFELYGKYYGRELLFLSKDSAEELGAFIRRHPRIIAKPTNSSCGNGVELIDTTTYADAKTLLDYLLSTERYLVEEALLQSPQLSKLHPSSVNCARVATILTGDNGNYDVTVFHPFLKIGRKGSIIDNGTNVRGIVVKIDAETGVLCTDGCDEAGGRFTEHPETGVVLKGYPLPDWEQAIQLVKELALILPSNRYIGWDLAHTANGWVVIEGNARGQFIGQQMTDVVGRKAELDELMKRI